MSNIEFKPGLPLTIVTLLAFLTLIGLGTWQALKIAPKEALVARIEAGLSAPATELPVHLDDPQSVSYRRFTFDGDVSANEPIKVFGTNLAGKPGYYLYKPVVRNFGRAVFVNFGWQPMEMKENLPLPAGTVSVSGVLMPSAVAGSFTPPNDPEKGSWFNANVDEMAAHFGLGSKDYYPFRIFADHNDASGALPLGGQVRVAIPNDHFEYMLTWYGIALALLGVFIAFGRQKITESS